MASVSEPLQETIWNLKRQLLDLINEATAAELTLFGTFGESERTVIVLDELKSVAERAAVWFSRLSNFQLRIAESQPAIASDMLDLFTRSIRQVQAEVPAMVRSVQEVKEDWELP